MIQLPYRDIPGVISAKALQEHYRLYLRYVEQLRAIDQAIPAANFSGANDIVGPARSLYEGQSLALAAVELHEAYFGNLSRTPPAVGADNLAMQAIAARWGSSDAWWREMYAAGLASRGWSVLARMPRTGALRVLGLDSHDCGAVLGYEIVCAIDVYEHAYWMDFGTAKAAYLERIARHLDWDTMAKRIAACRKD